MTLPKKSILLPHLIAGLAFLLIGLAYFNPILEGKVLPTHDITQHAGSAKEVLDFKEKTGETSLWTNSMFGGMPAYQIAANYPNSLFLSKPFFSLLTRGFPKPLNMLFLYFIGFYVLLLSFKVNWKLALAGALAYGFASYNIIIIDAGHNTKALAIGLAPLVVAAVNMTLNSRQWILGAALSGLALGFQIKVNHVQITYYLLFVLLAMGIAWLVDQLRESNLSKNYLRIPLLGLAFLLAVGANSGNLLTTSEYAKETTRGKVNLSKRQDNTDGLPKDYITGWSYGIAETGTLLIPNFHGGGSQSNMDYSDLEIYGLAKQQMGDKGASRFVAQSMYWGTQPGTNGPVYLGAVICFLFVFGLFIVKRTTAYWILSVSALAIALSWGKNFMLLSDLFIDYVPGYNKFRTVTMILSIVQITVPLLAIVGISKLLEGNVPRPAISKALKWSLGIVGGFCLLFAIFPSMFFDFIREGEIDQYQKQPDILDLIVDGRASLLRSDAFRSLLFVLLSAGAIWSFTKNWIKKEYLYLAFIALIAIDMWPVAARYLSPAKFEKENNTELVASKADNEILKDKSLSYRVLNFTVSPFNDATTSYFHKSLGGYHGAKLRRIQELIENQIDGEIQSISDAGFSNPSLSPVINMFNTKYFIASTKKGKVKVDNPGAMGNAWFVPKVEAFASADEEMAALSGFDPAAMATTTHEYASLARNDYGSGSIELVSYRPNYLKYEYNADKEGFVVFSEVFYRGNEDWVSTIDNQPSNHIRVNYHLRGMQVPAGKHVIEFRFDPPTYHKAETYSLISSLMLLLMVIGGIFKAYKNSRSQPEA